MVWQSLIAAGVLSLAATICFADVNAPKITTDKSIDCSTTKSIVRDVCRGKTTDRDKAVAIYEFCRRLMFQWPNRVDGRARHDTGHLLNTYGYSFCSQQALLTVHLWQEAGIKSYVWAVPGHSTMQAEWDGKHHWFDLLIGGYVFARDGKTIVSLQDIAKDKTLLSAAEKEGRVPKGFCPERTVLKDQSARFCKHAPDYIASCAKYIDDVNYMAQTAEVAARWKWGNPGGSRYKNDWRLRPGESVRWLWDYLPDQANCNVLKPKDGPRNYWVRASELPPNHFYGIAAEKRDVNWKYFAPYVRKVNGVETGRYAANGHHVYAPDLRKAKASAFEANSFAAGVEDGPALLASKPAKLDVKMHTPHIYTGAAITAEFVRDSADDVCRISIVCRGWDRKKRKMGTVTTVLYDAAKAKAGTGKVVARVDLKRPLRNNRDATIRIECAPAGKTPVGLNALTIDAIFQHNMFARPYLVAGKNTVTVEAAGGAPLKANPMTVTYAWVGGGKEKTHTKEVAASPTSYTIDVAGEEMPRMLRLEMSVKP